MELVGDAGDGGSDDHSILFGRRQCEASAAEVTPSAKLTKATRKMDAYTPMMIIQNLGDLGWKFFSASPYSSSLSKGRGVVAAEDMIIHTAGTMKF